MMRHVSVRAACLMGMICLLTGQVLAQQKIDLKYALGPRPIPGFTHVAPDASYTIDRGYGFDLQSKVNVVDRGAAGGFVTGADGRAFFFSAKVPEGAYQVTVTLGDPAGETSTTIKAETRRLMFEEQTSAPGRPTKLTFLTHVRLPQFPGGQVSLKERERLPILYVQWAATEPLIPFLELNWDEKLTLAFSGDRPAVQSIEITSAPPHTTIYLVGDSTMTDMMMDPFVSWGQVFTRYFKAPVLIANYAECGESATSFLAEQRWAKIMSEIDAGDWVLVQFGINDRTLAEDRIRQLFGQYISDTRAKNAFPVIVTSQNLQRGTLGAYQDVLRAIAKEQNVPLIDLNAMSVKLYEAMGEDLGKAFIDGTHHSGYGATMIARCVVQGVMDAKLPWAEHVVADWKTFDPTKPMPAAEYTMPMDPQLDPARPGGPGTPDNRGPMAGAVRTPRGGARGRGPATQPVSQPAVQ